MRTMWKFTKIQLNGRSPLAEILSRCSNKRNLRLVVYNLKENRVDCAAIPPHEVRQFTLSSEVVRSITCGGNGICNFAILAYDLSTHCVYVVDCTPELNAASAVLLCVVSELIGGAVPCHHDEQPVNPEDWDEDEDMPDDDWEDEYEDDEDDDDDEDYGWNAPEVVRRDARGRFVSKVSVPEKALQRCLETKTTGHRRFHLGSKRRG